MSSLGPAIATVDPSAAGLPEVADSASSAGVHAGIIPERAPASMTASNRLAGAARPGLIRESDIHLLRRRCGPGAAVTGPCRIRGSRPRLADAPHRGPGPPLDDFYTSDYKNPSMQQQCRRVADVAQR